MWVGEKSARYKMNWRNILKNWQIMIKFMVCQLHNDCKKGSNNYVGKSIYDLIGEEKEIPCSDKNGNIQGVAKIRDGTKLNGTIRVRLDFVGHINPSDKDEMITELKVKKYYL